MSNTRKNNNKKKIQNKQKITSPAKDLHSAEIKKIISERELKHAEDKKFEKLHQQIEKELENRNYDEVIHISDQYLPLLKAHGQKLITSTLYEETANIYFYRSIALFMLGAVDGSKIIDAKADFEKVLKLYKLIKKDTTQIYFDLVKNTLFTNREIAFKSQKTKQLQEYKTLQSVGRAIVDFLNEKKTVLNQQVFDINIVMSYVTLFESHLFVDEDEKEAATVFKEALKCIVKKSDFQRSLRKRYVEDKMYENTVTLEYINTIGKRFVSILSHEKERDDNVLAYTYLNIGMVQFYYAQPPEIIADTYKKALFRFKDKQEMYKGIINTIIQSIDKSSSKTTEDAVNDLILVFSSLPENEAAIKTLMEMRKSSVKRKEEEIESIRLLESEISARKTLSLILLKNIKSIFISGEVIKQYDMSKEPQYTKEKIGLIYKEVQSKLKNFFAEIQLLQVFYNDLIKKDLSELKESLASLNESIYEIDAQHKIVSDELDKVALVTRDMMSEADHVIQIWKTAKKISEDIFENQKQKIVSILKIFDILLTEINDEKLKHRAEEQPKKTISKISKLDKRLRALYTSMQTVYDSLQISINEVDTELRRIPEDSKEGEQYRTNIWDHKKILQDYCQQIHNNLQEKEKYTSHLAATHLLAVQSKERQKKHKAQLIAAKSISYVSIDIARREHKAAITDLYRVESMISEIERVEIQTSSNITHLDQELKDCLEVLKSVGDHEKKATLEIQRAVQITKPFVELNIEKFDAFIISDQARLVSRVEKVRSQINLFFEMVAKRKAKLNRDFFDYSRSLYELSEYLFIRFNVFLRDLYEIDAEIEFRSTQEHSNHLMDINVKLSILDREITELEQYIRSIKSKSNIELNPLFQFVNQDLEKIVTKFTNQFIYLNNSYNKTVLNFAVCEIKFAVCELESIKNIANELLIVKYSSIHENNEQSTKVWLTIQADYRKAYMRYMTALSLRRNAKITESTVEDIFEYFQKAFINNSYLIKDIINKYERANSFAKLLGAKKIDSAIDYLFELENILYRKIHFRGKFATLCGKFAYHSYEAAERIEINDIDCTIYDENPEALSSILQGHDFNTKKKYASNGHIHYIILEKIINGVLVQLKIAHPKYYVGNQPIAPLVSGDVCFHNPSQYYDTFQIINGRNMGIYVHQKHYFEFRRACQGEEVYALYNPYKHLSGYCLVLCKAIKQARSCRDTGINRDMGTANYFNLYKCENEVFPHLQKEFLKLFIRHSMQADDEIINLLRYSKEINEDTEKFVRVYFSARVQYQSNCTIKDELAFNQIVNRIIIHLKDQIGEHLQKENFQIVKIFHEIVAHEIKLPTIHPEHKLANLASPLSPLRQFALHSASTSYTAADHCSNSTKNITFKKPETIFSL